MKRSCCCLFCSNCMRAMCMLYVINVRSGTDGEGEEGERRLAELLLDQYATKKVREIHDQEAEKLSMAPANPLWANR